MPPVSVLSACRLKGGPGAALHHRMLQGYLYPSFTGAVNTEFATEKGIAMWDWLKEAWPYINPNATWSQYGSAASEP